jgi:hypothetical protein
MMLDESSAFAKPRRWTGLINTRSSRPSLRRLLVQACNRTQGGKRRIQRVRIDVL